MKPVRNYKINNLNRLIIEFTKRRLVWIYGKPLSQWQRSALPAAEIIHDKFHVQKYLNEASDKVRRREVKEHEELKESGYGLLKNEENLTEKQRVKFEMIRAANYEMSRAWEVRENFREVFKNVGLEESEAIFWVWSKAVKASGIKEVMKVKETFASHLRGVRGCADK